MSPLFPAALFVLLLHPLVVAANLCSNDVAVNSSVPMNVDGMDTGNYPCVPGQDQGQAVSKGALLGIVVAIVIFLALVALFFVCWRYTCIQPDENPSDSAEKGMRPPSRQLYNLSTGITLPLKCIPSQPMPPLPTLPYSTLDVELPLPPPPAQAPSLPPSALPRSSKENDASDIVKPNSHPCSLNQNQQRREPSVQIIGSPFFSLPYPICTIP